MSHYNRLVRYWSESPPVHVLVRMLFASSKSGSSSSRSSGPEPWQSAKPWETESIESLLSRWAAVGGSVG